MTITMIVELSCDRPDCTAAYAPATHELTSVEATRTGSILAGWTRHGGMDYCPAHREDPREVARIRELAAAGMTDGRIGERLGISRAAVYSLRRRHGIPPGLGRVGRPSGGKA